MRYDKGEWRAISLSTLKDCDTTSFKVNLGGYMGPPSAGVTVEANDNKYKAI